MRRRLGVCKKIFAPKSFERRVVWSTTPAFRCIQKNFRRRHLADDLSRTAIGTPIAVVLEQHGSTEVEDRGPNGVEIKLTHDRH